MTDCVVDASVAFKWLIREQHSSQAEALLADAITDSFPLIGPPHLPGEVLNAVYRRTRRSTSSLLTDAEAQLAAAQFLKLPIQIVSPNDLYQRAFGLVTSFRLPTVYDGIYVTLAQLLNIELWTADERLLASLRGRAPWVQWIGDYQ